MMTSTSSSSYSYRTTATEIKPVATIIRTKPPGQQWSDVIEVSIGEYRYDLGDIVRILTAHRSKFGRVEAFTPEAIVLATIDGSDCKFYYEEVRPVKQGDKPDIKPDPNRAFLTRKKGIL